MLKIKKNDEVVVIAGRDRGRRGAVLKVLDNGKVLVGGINLVKKHQKPNPNIGQQGGIVEQEAPMQASNVAIWNDETGKADRVGFRIEDGKKERFYKSSVTGASTIAVRPNSSSCPLSPSWTAERNCCRTSCSSRRPPKNSSKNSQPQHMGCSTTRERM